MKYWIPCALALALTACSSSEIKQVLDKASAQTNRLPTGITLVETFDGGPDSIAIPYAKYRLANGLTVVLHEDHSDPLVHVDVTYHVGSNREEPGRSGFAHFFEHMMFQGSANVADEQHFKTVSNAGGTLNGSTNSDRTNYYQTVPANQMETVLWLEADRMGLLLEAVTQEKFENQRETVKNERGQRVDNQPYGRVWETLMKNLYPEGHPYSWPVIGWIEDLNRADLNDLKRFFLRWYGPNNAALTIGGDIDPIETLKLVNKYFGSIPAGPQVQDLPKAPGKLKSDRYVTLEDNIHLPALALIIPTVYSKHADEPALDAAAKIMGQGKASLLYQRLVQSGRAVQATVQHQCREIACEMIFIVVQNPRSGETLAEMETAVRETINEFAERGVNQDDLQKFKAEYESNRVFGLQSVRGKVTTLAWYETFTGSPAGIDKEINDYLAVTPGDVTRVFEQYIADQPIIAMSVVPNGKTELAARTSNFSRGARTLPEHADGDTELALRPVADTFDRSVQPTPGSIGSADLPSVWEATLDNGVKVYGVPNDETPVTTVMLISEAGQRDEPVGKHGLAQLTAALMTEATTQHSAAEFTEALERIGARSNVYSDIYETTVELDVLSKHLPEGIELLQERLTQPAFSADDFKRLKSQTIEGLQQARKNPSSLAARARGAVLFGAEHPLSYPNSGLISTVEKLQLDDVKAFYKAHFPGRLRSILVSSNLSKNALLKQLQPFGSLSTSKSQYAQLSGPKAMHGRHLYLVNKPGAAQSSVHLLHPGLPYDALGTYYRARLMNFVLGGTFNSRVNLNLREDKGYTYGARSRFNGGREFGLFRMGADVNKDATAASIKEFLNELEQYAANGMSDEEFAYMRSAIGQRDALEYETPNDKLGLLAQVWRYDLPHDYLKRQQKILGGISKPELDELATKLLNPDDLSIVVVGDIEALRPELEALEIPITELDEDGFKL